MHRQRAEEMAHSPEMHHVTYNGKPIYIQHVDIDNQTALESTLIGDGRHERRANKNKVEPTLHVGSTLFLLILRYSKEA